MLVKIRDILIIVNLVQLNQFKKLIPNGKNFGVKISYAEQSIPRWSSRRLCNWGSIYW